MVFDQGQGSQNNHNDSSLSNNGISSNLTERFEAACTIADLTKESIVNGESNAVANLEKLTVVKLKTEVEKHDFEKNKMNIMRKAALIDLLRSEIQREEKRQDSDSSADLSSVSEEEGLITYSGGYDLLELVINKDDPCTFLILDESLQRFPFEGRGGIV